MAKITFIPRNLIVVFATLIVTIGVAIWLLDGNRNPALAMTFFTVGSVAYLVAVFGPNFLTKGGGKQEYITLVLVLFWAILLVAICRILTPLFLKLFVGIPLLFFILNSHRIAYQIVTQYQLKKEKQNV